MVSSQKILKRLKTFEDTEQLEEEAKDALGSLKQLEVYNQSQLKKQAKVQRENQDTSIRQRRKNRLLVYE